MCALLFAGIQTSHALELMKIDVNGSSTGVTYRVAGRCVQWGGVTNYLHNMVEIAGTNCPLHIVAEGSATTADVFAVAQEARRYGIWCFVFWMPSRTSEGFTYWPFTLNPEILPEVMRDSIDFKDFLHHEREYSKTLQNKTD